MKLVRQVSLTKRGHRYVFRYPAGMGKEILAAIASMAADGNDGFDWCDAALLSYQMGRRLERVPAQVGNRAYGEYAGLGPPSPPGKETGS